jgi:hypothetical protein
MYLIVLMNIHLKLIVLYYYMNNEFVRDYLMNVNQVHIHDYYVIYQYVLNVLIDLIILNHYHQILFDSYVNLIDDNVQD